MADAVFTKPIDAVQLVLTVLKRLNEYDLSNLDHRIRCQKIQYLAQHFKTSPTYKFNLYVRGPYSPDLTKDLFSAEETIKKIDVTPFASDELESRFSKLKQFVESKTTRELELVCTFHWLVHEAKLSQSDAVKRLVELKNASTEEIAKTTQSLKEVSV